MHEEETGVWSWLAMHLAVNGNWVWEHVRGPWTRQRTCRPSVKGEVLDFESGVHVVQVGVGLGRAIVHV
jgi:hypothetical protein